LRTAFDKATGSGDVAQAPAEPTCEQAQGQLNSTIDSLASNFANLPPETRKHLLEAAQPVAMPQAWSQEKAELWDKLDRQAQAYIAERELQAQQKISELGHRGKPADDFAPVLERYANHIPRDPATGQPMPAPAVMESLLAAHHALETHPQAALQWLANSYGVDLGQLGSNPAAAVQQQQYAQAAQQLQHQLAQLRVEQQQWQAQRQQYLQREVEGLINGKDHWPSIEDEAVRQVNAVREQNPSLFHMDPLRVVRDAVERAEKICGISDKQSAVEARKKADEAKRLASMNVRSVLSKSPSNISGDMWSSDNWRAAYDKASGR
jgi:hypothetical protein